MSTVLIYNLKKKKKMNSSKKKKACKEYNDKCIK